MVGNHSRYGDTIKTPQQSGSLVGMHKNAKVTEILQSCFVHFSSWFIFASTRASAEDALDLFKALLTGKLIARIEKTIKVLMNGKRGNNYHNN